MITPDAPVHALPATTLAALTARETDRYARTHPASAALADVLDAHWFACAPSASMRDWPLAFPLCVRDASGARFSDVDGQRYADFCLGDGAALFGHSPEPVAEALAAQAARGLATSLPGPDAAWVGAELARRFGLPLWQVTATVSDATRALLRLARAATGRPCIVVFAGCRHDCHDLHGRFDETADAVIDAVEGHAPAMPTTRIVPFNDLPALAAALADEQVAAVLCEPALTSGGLVLADDGFHPSLRALTRRHGTLLIVDESHTLSCGPGAYTQAHALEPDAMLIGPAIAGGVPCAVSGISAALADTMRAAAPAGRTGSGMAVAGTPLQFAALRAMLAHVMSDDAYARMHLLASRLADELHQVFARHGLDWRVTRLGAYCTLLYTGTPPRTRREADATAEPALTRLLHLYLLNRGFVLSPFNNMMLTSPAGSLDAVVALADAVDACLTESAAGAAPAGR